MASDARYDGIAEWYRSWAGDGEGLISEGVGDMLPPVRDVRVLDVACGHGRASRGLARLGARVTGVDLSAELIAHARERDVELNVEYHVGDAGAPERWWNGTLFDGAVCEMAMMDIDDLDAIARGVATVVRTGGWFVSSLVHPCFPGNDAGLSSWPPDRSYFDEGRWTSPDHNPDGVRLRVGSSHRMLSTYVNTFLDAGFVLERMFEPRADVPMLLLMKWRRA